MGYKVLEFKLPTNYTEDQLKAQIHRSTGLKSFSFQVDHKNLDARNRRNIHWVLRVGVSSDELPEAKHIPQPALYIPYQKRNKKVVVVGSGPAGFFCGFVLQKAGYEVTILERGLDVINRGKAIRAFEQAGRFNPAGNYAFGEGGAGTFSDGKLTSRSKHISAEKQFILTSYIQAGAPPEIAYLAHPHLGTDNLKIIVKNLRNEFEQLGGTFAFETIFTGFTQNNGKVTRIETNKGELQCDVLFLAPGHSAYETYRMLMENGVQFRTKNFALGTRMEHLQETINEIQWGRKALPGVKAAEYRITSRADGKHQVFSFCMCPGGMVVPATAYSNSNIVNGMSYYSRSGRFANAACVAAIHPDELAGKTLSALDALKYVESLEQSFYQLTTNYQAPACCITDFTQQKESRGMGESSYPLGLQALPLWEHLPGKVVHAMQKGLSDFTHRMKGFEAGILLGLESKTSAPVQAIRTKEG
ncbi:MAG: NAD(P)/FAD-dependent oxidoreductase, partial [Bacteroidota bacterium]